MLPPTLAQLLASLDATPEHYRNPVQNRIRAELHAVSGALGDGRVAGLSGAGNVASEPGAVFHRQPPAGPDLRLEPWTGSGPVRCFVCGR